MSIHMLKVNMLMNVVNSHQKNGLIHLSEQENVDDIHEANLTYSLMQYLPEVRICVFQLWWRR